MIRRTVSLPDAIDARVREAAGQGESYSAAVARLLDAGLRASGEPPVPGWVGAGEGPTDLGRRAEAYLAAPVDVA